MHRADIDELVIEPGQLTRSYWLEVWNYRLMLWQLTRRDVKSKYKQTFLGLGWTVVNPMVSMIVLTLVFERIAGLPAEAGLPYPLLVLSGLIGWQILASGAKRASGALVRNKSLIKKLYFPRMILLVQVQLVVLFDFLLATIVFAALMGFYGLWPSWTICSVPLFLCLAVMTSFGTGLWLSVLNARYRDFAHLVPYLVQIGMFISPVGFTSWAIPEEWSLLYSLNPMVGVLDGFRWSLLGGRTEISFMSVGLGSAVALLLVVSGIVFFRKCEGTLADVL